jgi:hypothetical protein
MNRGWGSRRPLCITALLLAWQAVAAEPPLDAPDPEFLEYLGETAGLDPEIIRFMESRAAKRAVKDAAEKEKEKEKEPETNADEQAR